MPRIGGKIASFVLAHIRWLQKGMPIVPKSELDIRNGICAQCPHNTNHTCTICGCPLDKKNQMATESCPELHWIAYTGDGITKGKNDCWKCDKK